MNNKYYRIVYFDKAGKFLKVQIKAQSEIDIDKLISTYSYPEIIIYRCNSKGNNYSRRRIYPN